MRNTSLTPEQILKLAGASAREVATWCSANLFLPVPDCPECGQAAPEECDLCVDCGEPECTCACECTECNQRECVCPCVNCGAEECECDDG